MDREFEFHEDELINPNAKKQLAVLSELDKKIDFFYSKEKELDILNYASIIFFVTTISIILFVHVFGESRLARGFSMFFHTSLIACLYFLLSKFYPSRKRMIRRREKFLRMGYGVKYWKVLQTKALFGKGKEAKFKHYLYDGCWN